MARLPRYILAGQPQHVIQRGNNRQAIFGADGDYRFCLEKLQMAFEKHGCAIHAYVLMTNHVHLLLTPQQAAYRQLFRTRIVVKTLDEIREATNKAWALGDDRFERKIEPWFKRRVAPMARGGDHKSDAFRKQARINRV